MIRHDISHWPLVLSFSSGATTLEEQLAFFAAWNEWLDRGQRFATLRVFADPESLARPAGGGKEAKAWLHANSDRLKKLVVGMATVVPSEMLESMNRMNAEKLFGVPAQAFGDVASALSWLGAIATPQNIVLPDFHTVERSLP
jgi:hypothetical protein